MRQSGLWVLIPIAAIGVILSPAIAEDDAEASMMPEWRLDINSWIWLYGLDGDLGIGNVKAEIDSSFFDIADEADSILAFSGRMEIGYGRLGAFIDGTYTKLEFDDQSDPLGLGSIDVTLELGIIDFGAMYRLAEWNGGQSKRSATLDVYAGARYVTLELELDPKTVSTSIGDREWIDPIVGVKVCQPLTKQLHLAIWGDIGGFGVESDLTWSATAVFGYNFNLFTCPMTIYAGYRAIGLDYSDDDARGFSIDGVLHGPTLGFQFNF